MQVGQNLKTRPLVRDEVVLPIIFPCAADSRKNPHLPEIVGMESSTPAKVRVLLKRQVSETPSLLNCKFQWAAGALACPK